MPLRSHQAAPSLLRRLINAAGRRKLLRAASGSLVLQAVAALLSFATAIVLARMLGAQQFGSYAYGVAWAGLLGTPAVLGLDRFVIRGIATYEVGENWGLMKGLLRRAHQAVLSFSLVVALIAAGLGGALLDGSVRTTFWVALGLVPLVALTTVRQAAMQGLGQVVRGQLPDTLIRPVGLLVGVVAVTLAGLELDAAGAMALNLAAAVVALIVGFILLRRAFPPQLRAATPEYRLPLWARSAVTLTVAGGLQVANPYLVQVLLGSIDGPASVGIYQAVAKGAGVLSFVLLAVNLSLAPRVARLHATGETEQLQRIVTRATMGAALLTLPLCIGLIALRSPYLGVYGSEFRAGGDALIIMACAQLVNVMSGSVGVLLMMTGHEREAGLAIALGVSVTTALCAVLIPPFGIEGAALASGASIVTWNVTMLVYVRRRLGIHASVLGDLARLRRGAKPA